MEKLLRFACGGSGLLLQGADLGAEAARSSNLALILLPKRNLSSLAVGAEKKAESLRSACTPRCGQRQSCQRMQFRSARYVRDDEAAAHADPSSAAQNKYGRNRMAPGFVLQLRPPPNKDHPRAVLTETKRAVVAQPNC